MSVPTRTCSLAVIFALTCAGLPVFAQQGGSGMRTGGECTPGSTVRVVPGEEYAAGAMHRFFFGDLWRSLWTTPIEVPVIDLATFHGGLTPTKRGGGQQTQSLRFVTPQGVQYKFRSLDKDPSKALDPRLRETFVDDLLQDMISTANPVSALVAAPLLNAAGILNAQPELCVLPDDGSLGAFDAEFGGLPGMMEIHPDELDDEENSFGGAERVAGTYSLLNTLDKNNDDRVNPTGYLKSRLMDIFMSDWDRHYDQYRWARYEIDGRDEWFPVPRDRDQAFCRFDGVAPVIAKYFLFQIQSCDEEFPNLEFLTYTGRHLDRRFLSSLERPVFDSLGRYLAGVLTDSLIEAAVRCMPEPMYEAEGAELIRVLKSRRDALPQAALDYYDVLSPEVDVWLSNKRQFVLIDRIDDGTMRLTARRRDDEGRPEGPPLFDRTFHREETDEVRLYLQDGDDSVHVRGTVSCSIPVHVMGGDGGDAYTDASETRRSLLGLFPRHPANLLIYDSGKKTTVDAGPNTTRVSGRHVLPENDTLRYENPVRDWGSLWRPGFVFNYNTDLGPMIGGGAVFYDYGFRAAPYRSRLSMLAGYAPYSNRGSIVFDYDFHMRNSSAAVGVEAGLSGFIIVNFFGFGNESQGEVSAKDDYNFRQTHAYIEPVYSGDITRHLRLRGGLLLRHVSSEFDEEAPRIDRNALYGLENTTVGAVTAGLTYDSRDLAAAPRSGLYCDLRGAFFPALFDTRERFIKAAGDLRLFLPADVLTDWTLALHAGGEKLWGDYPFFEAAFLGGIRNARGYYINRFAGDASLFGGAELRAGLLDLFLIVPTRIGAFAFVESGRVFYDGESSKRWHASYGGGLSFAPVLREVTFSLSVGVSEESTRTDFTAGFAF